MKLLRFGPPGREKPGLLDSGGVLRDASAHVADWAGEGLSPATLARIAALEHAALPAAPEGERLGPPVGGTRNFVGIGLNYADHAAETGAAIPKEPIIFLKSLNAIAGPDDDIVLPPGSVKTDWEAELAFCIGRTARNVPEEAAMDHIAGFLVCNDVSEREWQSERGGTWDKGKGADGYGPLGPWLVTPDEVPDPQNLAIRCEVDGEVMQDGSTRTMIFGVVHLLSYVSRFITLHPGDIVTTGTPPGVGLAKKPQPIYLRAGNVVRVSVEGLGVQVQRVVQG
jgi:ureidoglycolate lyase